MEMTHLNFSAKNLLLLFIVLGASIKKLFTLNFECRIWNAFYWFSNCVKNLQAMHFWLHKLDHLVLLYSSHEKYSLQNTQDFREVEICMLNHASNYKSFLLMTFYTCTCFPTTKTKNTLAPNHQKIMKKSFNQNRSLDHCMEIEKHFFLSILKYVIQFYTSKNN